MTPPVRRRRTRRLSLQGAILIAAAVLIAMTWQFTASSVTSAQREAQASAENNVANLALGVEWQLNRQIQSLDQLMALLVSQWQDNPTGFDPTAWARRSLIVGDGSLQVLVLNADGVVTAASDPESVGLNLSDRPYFRAQRDSSAAGLFVGPASRWHETGRWEINLSRRLEGPDGSFAGALVVAYDPWALTNQLQQIDLGLRGLIALVGDDGSMRALVAPYGMPSGETINGSAMFQAMNDVPQSVWTGPSAPDGVVRVHAFRRLRDQDLTIVIGVDRMVAMRDAETWVATAWPFAIVITLAIVGLAIVLLWIMAAYRSREQRLARDRSALEAAYAVAEAAKAQAEARTTQVEGLLSGMSDGVMLLDADLRLALWNERFAPLTGVPERVLRVGTPMEVLLRAQAEAGEFGPCDVEQEVARRMRALRDHPDGTFAQRDRPCGRSIELRRTALPDGGVITLYTDVTARRHTEQARDEARRIAHQITEQKASLVAVVSHEIRTPLNAVLGSLSLLEGSGLTAPQRRLAATAHQAGEALLTLTNDILELSRMEAGQLELVRAPFDIGELLIGVCEMFHGEAQQRGIALDVEIAPRLPRHLSGDGRRLRQVVMNFVSNAIKFADPGRVTIRAEETRLGATLGAPPALLVAVRDPGPLIPEHDALQLFRPFSRLLGARTSAKPGTGLGLAICERLARLMSGQVGVGAAPEGGNEFWITVPLEVAVPDPVPEAAAASLIGRGRIGRARRLAVLLVEDIPANHLVTAILLRRARHHVDVAESGCEAIAMIQRYPYDIVLMDLSMPGMDGEQATRRLRGLPGAAGRTPVVALTATSAPEDHWRCEAAGMDGVLAKPVAEATLLAAIEDCVIRRRAPAAPPSAAAQDGCGLDDGGLDDGRLAELRGALTPPVLQRLLQECLDDMRRRLPALRAAVDGGDVPAIEPQAHALAGLAATYGMTGMERRMRRVMAAGRAADPARAAREMDGADAELQRAADGMAASFSLPA